MFHSRILWRNVLMFSSMKIELHYTKQLRENKLILFMLSNVDIFIII